MARPTKQNDDTHAAIIKALAIGATRKDASQAAGVDYTTFLNWMQRGESAKSGRFFEFFNAVTKTEALTRINFVNVIAKAANSGDWRAAEAYLKRRDRANWGDNVDITSKNESLGGNGIDDAERARAISELAHAIGGLISNPIDTE